MVNIGGREFNLPTGAITKTLTYGFFAFVGVIILCIVGFFVYKRYKNKATYTNKITLTQRFENGTSRTISGMMGGKYVSPSGVWDFKIKIPKQFKNKSLGYVPDFSLADSDGTLHFLTVGDGTIWQQVEWVVKTKEVAVDEQGNVIYENNLIMLPIRTDVKQVTVNSIKSFGDMVNGSRLKVVGMALGAIAVVAIASVIMVYVLTKVKCNVPVAMILPLLGL